MMATFLLAVLYAAIAVCVVVYFLVFFNRPAALQDVGQRAALQLEVKVRKQI